ncbi:hypothetical protein ACFQV2_08515 [Actinokineospora soli]|uniref:Uncharacterized protein n=1 Tax=Actinokineospora soli TaxID=1048753 RepID=A0ABW2TLB6_9PSEU
MGWFGCCGGGAGEGEEACEEGAGEDGYDRGDARDAEASAGWFGVVEEVVGGGGWVGEEVGGVVGVFG